MTPEMLRTAKHLVTNSDHFEKDCDYFLCELTQNFDWFSALDFFRQTAILALAIALGWKNFLGLSELILFLSRGSFDRASQIVEEKGYHYIADVLRSGEVKFDIVK